MNRVFFSLIVPVYNAEKYLKTCIESVLNQDFCDFELLLIDDGSTDNSGNICNYYVKNDKRIKVIHKENGGVSSARNVGLNNSSGKYIMFIDSDDYIAKNCLSKIKLVIDKNKVDILKFSYKKKYRFLETVYKFKINTNKLILKNDYEKDIFPYIFNSFDLSNVWGGVIRKEIIDKVMFDVDYNYSEDFYTMMGCVFNSNSIYFMSESLYFYKILSSSSIHNLNYKKIRKILEDNINVYTLIENELRKRYRYIIENDEVNTRIINLICNCIYDNFSINPIKFKAQINDLKKHEKISNYMNFRISYFKSIIKKMKNIIRIFV